jgi:hypothetical protein
MRAKHQRTNRLIDRRNLLGRYHTPVDFDVSYKFQRICVYWFQRILQFFQIKLFDYENDLDIFSPKWNNMIHIFEVRKYPFQISSWRSLPNSRRCVGTLSQDFG